LYIVIRGFSQIRIWRECFLIYVHLFFFSLFFLKKCRRRAAGGMTESNTLS